MKKIKKTKCIHNFNEMKDYGVIYYCVECGKTMIWEFDPYLWQSPSKEYIKSKLDEINEALLKITEYKNMCEKYLK